MFTDIEGSRALLQRAGEDVYAQVLAGHHELIRSALAGHGGTEVDTAGAGFFAVFSSPRACAAAALEMQRTLGAHAWPRRHEQIEGLLRPEAGGPVALECHAQAQHQRVPSGRPAACPAAWHRLA